MDIEELTTLTATELQEELDLNDKQIAFCEAFLLSGNATQSAIEAGYSAHSAHSQGSRLLRQAKVKRYLEVRRSTMLTEAYRVSQLAVDDLLTMMTDMATGAIPTKTIVLSSGNLKEEFDRKGALEMLARVHAMFTDRQELSIEGLELLDD